MLKSSPSFAALLAAVAALSSCGFGPSEKADLPQECVVANATLASARTPIDLAMERAGQTLLFQYPADRYALLEMPGCRVTPLIDAPGRVGLSDIFILPGGTRLFPTSEPGGATSWWYARGVDSAPIRMEFFSGSATPPQLILSTDGEWVAWLRSGADRENFRVELVMRRPEGKEEKTVLLATLERGLYELLELDVHARELTLARHLDEFFRLGFDGGTRWRVTPGEIEAQPTTYRRLGQGYFAWDAVRESGPYRMGWSLPANASTYTFERLRQIQHAAVDPSGRYAAASLDTQYGRLLSLRDAISIVRLSDRREVLRKYFPRFNRSQVAFLTARYFAYSDGNRVRVLRLPE